MRYSTVKYFIKEGALGLVKNRLMTIASIGTVCACILIISITYCIAANLDFILEQLESSMGVTVILNEDVSYQEVNRIGDEIEKAEHVSSVVYISPDEALESLKKEWNTKILDGFDEDDNPLSGSYEVSVDDIKNQTAVVESLKKIPGVFEVNHALYETQILMNVNNGLRIGSIFIIIILCIMAIVIITNTIKISVYARRNEINIMKFVGATDWFIRWPFIVEGIFLGLIGAVLPLFVSGLIYNASVEYISSVEFIRNWIIFRTGNEIYSVITPVSILLGIALGSIGSVFSIRKYLRV